MAALMRAVAICWREGIQFEDFLEANMSMLSAWLRAENVPFRATMIGTENALTRYREFARRAKERHSTLCGRIDRLSVLQVVRDRIEVHERGVVMEYLASHQRGTAALSWEEAIEEASPSTEWRVFDSARPISEYAKLASVFSTQRLQAEREHIALSAAVSVVDQLCEGLASEIHLEQLDYRELARAVCLATPDEDVVEIGDFAPSLWGGSRDVQRIVW
jgi:hypothetical protein